MRPKGIRVAAKRSGCFTPKEEESSSAAGRSKTWRWLNEPTMRPLPRKEYKYISISYTQDHTNEPNMLRIKPWRY